MSVCHKDAKRVSLSPPPPPPLLSRSLSTLLRFCIVLETEFVCIAKQENQVDAVAFSEV